MISDLSVVGPILLGAAAVMLLVISPIGSALHGQSGLLRTTRKKEPEPNQKGSRASGPDGDLAELYRATGR